MRGPRSSMDRITPQAQWPGSSMDGIGVNSRYKFDSCPGYRGHRPIFSEGAHR